MLDYLVEWARIKYASDTFSPTKIKLTSYIDRVFATLNESASINAVNLHHEVEENASVFADGKMLISIIQNIVSNAIKHTKQGGSINVSAWKQDDRMVIKVQDTGIGMSKEIQDKLFSPQIKTLSAARKENKGAGIGLLLGERLSGEKWGRNLGGKHRRRGVFLLLYPYPLDKPEFRIESAEDIAF
jgi:signal transduction histidine kinase